MVGVLPPPAIKPDAFLRWAGSKKQLVEQLASFWSDDYSRYVEPFAGSSRLYFRLLPKKALLADKNSELIEAYDVVKQHPVRLFAAISQLTVGRKNYYSVRARAPETLGTIDRAARFIYLNRFCFNGIYRTNQLGQFNVPYGQTSRKRGTLPSLESLRACSEALKSAEVRPWDFGTTLRYANEGDFVYLDPPYAVTHRRVFREYSASPFTIEDLSRLAEHLARLDDRNVHFVVSYADTREARRQFSQWDIRRVRVRRHIAGFSDARRYASEILVTNTRPKHA